MFWYEKIPHDICRAPARGYLVADVWSGIWERFELPINPDCPACGLGQLNYLKAESWGEDAARLCGHDAVQIRLAGGKVDLYGLGKRLKSAKAGKVVISDYLVRLRTEQHELTVFPDNRVIVKGTDDVGIARSLVAKYISTWRILGFGLLNNPLSSRIRKLRSQVKDDHCDF